MNEQEIVLVEQSWERVVPIADAAAQLFYAKLFTIDPTLRPMFSQTDMADQRKKLTQMITVAVKGLRRLDELLPAVEALGARHGQYGVTPEHYDTVGEALLWTLAQGLGEHFTPAVEAAWAKTYITLAGVMQRGASLRAA